MREHYPKASELAIFTAWKSVRTGYYNQTCPVRFRNTLPFLDDCRARTESLSISQGSDSETETTTRKLSHSERLTAIYDEKALDLLVQEVGKHPDLYGIKLSSCNNKLKRVQERALDSWKSVVHVMRERYPEASELAIFTAWRSVRTGYFNNSCPVRFRGNLPFLDECRARTVSASASEDSESVHKITTQKLSPSERLTTKYDDKALDFLVQEVGKRSDLYRICLSGNSTLRSVQQRAPDAWRSVLSTMRERYPDASELAIFTAWKSVRTGYYNRTCPVRFRGNLPFLDECRARTVSASVCQDSESEPEETDPSELLPSERLTTKYGEDALDDLMVEIEKHPSFYSIYVNASSPLSVVGSPSRLEEASEAWKTIMAVMESKYPGVSELAVFTAWKSVRSQYHRNKCTKRLRGKLPFLDNLSAPGKQNRHVSAVDLFVEEYGPDSLGVLFEEISKEEMFFEKSFRGCHDAQDMPEPVRKAWERIVNRVIQQIPEVSADNALKAWLSVRKNYFNSAGQKCRWNKKIVFLNEWKARKDAEERFEANTPICSASRELSFESRPRPTTDSFQASTSATRLTRNGARDMRQFSAADRFMEAHGEHAFDVLLGEISQEETFFQKNFSSSHNLHVMAEPLREAWERIMNKVREQIPDVSPKDALRAWASIRSSFNPKRKTRWDGKIAFLYAWKAMEDVEDRTQENIPSRSASPEMSFESRLRPRADNFQASTSASRGGHRSAADHFTEAYGEHALDVLLGEISQEETFFQWNSSSAYSLTEMAEPTREAWERIMSEVREQIPGVFAEDALKAWMSIRRYYFNPKRKTRWDGKIDFLNEWKARQDAEEGSETNAVTQPEETRSRTELSGSNLRNPSVSADRRGSSAADLFLETHGPDSMNVLLEAISQEEVFFERSLTTTSSPRELPQPLRDPWKRIMSAVREQIPDASSEGALKAWLTVRRHYFIPYRKSRWDGQIAFLNEWKERQKAEVSSETNTARRDVSMEARTQRRTESSSSSVQGSRSPRKSNDSVKESPTNNHPGAEELLIQEAGKYPCFFALRMTNSSRLSDVQQRGDWQDLMKTIKDRFRGVEEETVFTAWRRIRMNYGTQQCPQKFVGRLPYLDALVRREVVEQTPEIQSRGRKRLRSETQNQEAARNWPEEDVQENDEFNDDRMLEEDYSSRFDSSQPGPSHFNYPPYAPSPLPGPSHGYPYRPFPNMDYHEQGYAYPPYPGYYPSPYGYYPSYPPAPRIDPNAPCDECRKTCRCEIEKGLYDIRQQLLIIDQIATDEELESFEHRIAAMLEDYNKRKEERRKEKERRKDP
ncbi:hypothetical protein L596_019676 [Steinernema carpocapsae]|uniref:MADF domain-containing protein n=1 Tax=Steinernema carpocapsae TaxID=34508 RepID=A0A4U5MR89_STECR|nr:hypothetical protein L596_019676 [Steinernema carpocapsae]